MYEYRIKEIIKIIDGDTVDVLIDLGFNVFHKERVRLNRIDTPETATKDIVEKNYGLEAKAYVIDWLGKQKQIIIQTYKDDKYGRLLADFYGDNRVCLNDLLINEGYAWKYDGETKQKNLALLEAKRKEKL